MKTLKTNNGKTLVVLKVTIPENQFYFLQIQAKEERRTLSMVLESIIDEVMTNE